LLKLEIIGPIKLSIKDRLKSLGGTPIIIQHINQLVCGELVDGFSKGLMKNLKELGTFKHGVSVGFGNGDKNLKY